MKLLLDTHYSGTFVMRDQRLIARMNETHPLNQEAHRHLQQAQQKPPRHPELRVMTLARWAVKNVPTDLQWTPILEELLQTIQGRTPKRQMNYFLRETPDNEPSNLLVNLRESRQPEQAGHELLEHLQNNLHNQPEGELASPGWGDRD